MNPISTPFAQYIEDNQQALIDRLAEAVAIASVSGDVSYRPEVHRMGAWLAEELKKLNVA